MHLAVPQHQG